MTQERAARVHSQHSQRVKSQNAGDRKVAFKGTLDNPHRVSWPTAPANVQNTILAHLVDLLDGVADFHRNRTSSKKRKRTPEKANELSQRSTRKWIPSGDPAIDQDTSTEDPSTLLLLDHAEKSEPPSILNSLTYGINAVTKRLENQIERSRAKLVLKTSNETKTTEEVPDPIHYLFVCRADVDPSILIDHLPYLVATYNVLRQKDFSPIILATLPKGAESTLAQAMGVRRLAALAIDASSAVSRERLTIVTNSLPLVTAPWLSSTPTGSYIQTHIKQLRTTAPRDMKAAREARMKGKAAAKLRRSEQRTVATITKRAAK
ncbi:hypothetical protein D9756_005959 [Leucocoprinus leucothites]|uniref:Uncharacterized protein n=1 Tax=Leucocoprinus leucothites TaxID=201217 RepID=A0A8H5FXL4_9AGAR|nr:hypothetical protein D9756_005959 [Leucoagaricus leucothites]